MTAYDGYKKQSDQILKKYEERAQQIHAEAMEKIDNQAKEALMNLLFVIIIFVGSCSIAILALSSLGISRIA